MTNSQWRRGPRGLCSTCLAPLLAATLTTMFSLAASATEPSGLAVASFDFRDTSGEVRDQKAEHTARLSSFNTILRDDLSRRDTVRLVPLTCEGAQCTASEQGLAALAAQARTGRAKYLLVGEIHKMSTLVGWVKFAVLDLETERPTCDRFLTYRGDTDEAWERAAAYAAREVEKHCLPPR